MHNIQKYNNSYNVSTGFLSNNQFPCLSYRETITKLWQMKTSIRCADVVMFSFCFIVTHTTNLTISSLSLLSILCCSSLSAAILPPLSPPPPKQYLPSWVESKAHKHPLLPHHHLHYGGQRRAGLTYCLKHALRTKPRTSAKHSSGFIIHFISEII